MKKRLTILVTALVLLTLVLSACQPAAPAEEAVVEEAVVEEAVVEEAVVEEAAAPSGLDSEAAAIIDMFFDQDQLDRDKALMSQEPLNPDAPIWEQYLIDNPVDTTEFKKDGPYTICFSNAGVNNPWRVVGYTNMVEEVGLHAEIAEFVHVDAEGSDEKQIADIEDLLAGGKCDVMIVSPNTTAALTPAVEKACEVLPVIVFDRGVTTDCTTSFITPIGGYAFGISGAEFIVDNLPDGGNVLALRILPGVDVLEYRWGAAKQIFEENPQITVVGVEFGDGNNTKVKTIVNDYLDRFGTIDAVWMDAGATAVAALEAFQDAGAPFPVMVGEDQNDYLKFWKENGLTAIAPTFPTYQWRTPIIAALKILAGEPVQKEWILPQQPVTEDNLDFWYDADSNMPPLHYAQCGCEGMPNYPEAWGGTK